jgi:hypothetical protein
MMPTALALHLLLGKGNCIIPFLYLSITKCSLKMTSIVSKAFLSNISPMDYATIPVALFSPYCDYTNE